MNEKFNTLLSICIIPPTVELIVENEKLNNDEAIESFYQSKTYELLSNEDTKIWHYSPLTLYNMWKSEIETGEIDFPEETF